MPIYNIDIEKKYKFVREFSKINYNGKTLVIEPLSANWIVLDRLSQLEVFNFLEKGHSIKEALDCSYFNKDDINYVITQIEARRLQSKQVHSTIEDKRSLHLYLTNQCNLACPHCYMFSGIKNENELTTDELIKLLKDYKNIVNGTRVTISGGEPTIRIDFYEIVKFASEIGLEVNILTNGTLLSPENIATLSKYIYSVQISLDGYSEESDSIIRGKGHFQKALIAIDEFLKYGVETSIAITPPFSILQDHTDEYVKFARQLLKKYSDKPFHIKFTEELSNGRSINPSIQFNERYSSLINIIKEKLYQGNYDLMKFVQTMRNNVVLDNCMFGVFAISSQGNVYFCPEITNLPIIDNIRTASLKEIYEKSLDAEKATSVSKLKPCNGCELRYICGGGCRIKEFPMLTNRQSFDVVDYNSIPSRYCNVKIKEKFYDLMIQSNEYLYLSIED